MIMPRSRLSSLHRVPMRTRGLKLDIAETASDPNDRVPMRTRGLKLDNRPDPKRKGQSRSYADARIETPCGARGLKHNKV